MRVLAVGSCLAGASVSLWGCGGVSETTAAPAPPAVPYDPSTVNNVWNNHFGAFATFDEDKIMLDYDDTSMISTFNDKCFNTSDEPAGLMTYTGKVAIKGFFTALFDQLGRELDNVNYIGPSGSVAAGEGGPVVKEAVDGASDGNVFLTWRTVNTLDKPIDFATDSFSFKKNGEKYLINHQTIVSTETKTACPESPGQKPTSGNAPIYAAWTNHLEAFAGKQLDAIMEDYTNESIVQVYDNRAVTYMSYTGIAEITDMFNDLFNAIRAGAVGGDEGIKIGLIEIDPSLDSVFLAWQSNSHPKATDTFYFNGAKIHRQNIVVTTSSRLGEVAMV